MSNLSLRKVISFVILFSLVLQSCGPLSLRVTRPILSVASESKNLDREVSNFQPPVFDRPEPRVGERPNSSQNNAEQTSNQVGISTPVASATPITPTPAPSAIPQENNNPTIDNSASAAAMEAENVSLGGIDWVLNGNADSTTVNGAIKLTDDDYMVSGSAWAAQQIDLRQDFDKSFMLYVGDEPTGPASGADGIAFVLQSVGTNALGDLGGALGYAHMAPSIAVEFDTYYNYEYNDPTPNPLSGNDNHVAILKNGVVTHDGSLPLSHPYYGFEDGDELPVHIT